MNNDETMSQPTELLQFLTIAKSSEIWRSISSAIMTITNEAQFEAGPNGIKFRSKDQAREAFIDVFIPTLVFQQFHCPILLKFGIRIDEFSKIINRVNGNIPVEVRIQDKFLAVTTIGTFFCCYKSNLIESRPSVSALEEIAFDAKLVIGTETLAAILEDVGVFSEKLTLKTIRRPEIATTFSGVSEGGAAAAVTVSRSSRITKIRHHTSMAESTEGTYPLRLISDLVDSIGATSEYVQLEYSSGGPLRLKFLLLESVILQLYLAPQLVR
jgi:proliferating cell nuclear antigen